MAFKTQSDRFIYSLLAGASALAMTAVAAPIASAQDDQNADDAEETDNIVVRGIRRSIQSAQDIKQNSDTFVDAITAADIGALPDRSVSEALQRVPGVNVLRFAGPNDPDHFAVEGSGVVIRGLPFVRSELNGRDVFGANSGGVLGFEDVSPELLGSVVVFKNQSADLIEGGIAGTIDLRTRVPFDHDGQLVSASVEGNYTDLAGEFTPTFSGLYSNNWETGLGRIGFLVNASYSELNSRADGTQLAAFEPTSFDGGPTVYVPAGGGIRSQLFDRERQAYAAALQWESTDGRWLSTFQFLRSDSTLQWGENVIETTADNTSGTRGGLDSADFQFNDDGVFIGGTINDNSQWRGPNATAALLGGNGGQQLNLRRDRLEKDVTNDFGLNIKFSASENLRFNFDAQYIESKAEIVDLTLHTSFFAPVRITPNGENGIPTFTYLRPNGASDDYFQDPSNYFVRSFLDHTSQNDADEIAFRGDVEYDFNGDGWIKSVRAGVRYVNQDTTLRQSDFNWGNISEVWTGADIGGQANGDFNATESVLLVGGNSNPALNAATNGLFGTFLFDNFQRGNVGDTGLGGAIPAYIGPSVDGFGAYQQAVLGLLEAGGRRSANACGSIYAPLTLRECTNGDSLIGPGSPFLASELGSVERDNWAIYARIDFGSDGLFGGGTSLDGNIGVRYVRTDRTVATAQVLPSFDSLFNPEQVVLCDPAVLSMRQAADSSIIRPGFCDLDLATLQTTFGDGQVVFNNVDVDYDEWLPSLNLKLDFGGGHIARFAASKTMSRPGIDQLNQRPVIGTLPEVNVPDSAGGFMGQFVGFQGSQSGNAQLLPQTAINLDLSWEWYFADAGSVTVTGFYKNIDDFITFSPQSILGADGQPILIDGVPIQFNTEQNLEDNATLKGFEIAYNQFYDFLPGFLSGIGVQFNYTYIDAEGVPPIVDNTLPLDDQPVANFEIDRGLFPRVSEHNINMIGLYEKGPIQARVAYNWRSEFQVTPRDVIFPFATIYQPSTGQVDASLFYSFTENVKAGIQGVNLLDDVTVTTQSINDAGVRAPRSFFRNDRRITFILRATF